MESVQKRPALEGRLRGVAGNAVGARAGAAELRRSGAAQQFAVEAGSQGEGRRSPRRDFGDSASGWHRDMQGAGCASPGPAPAACPSRSHGGMRTLIRAWSGVWSLS